MTPQEKKEDEAKYLKPSKRMRETTKRLFESGRKYEKAPIGLERNLTGFTLQKYKL